jgi:phospholipid/cholesterol/gamma-HCH transport system substrate-binding protein
METRANYIVVGIFTLTAIVAAFVFIYWAAAFGDRGESTLLRVRIPGSASGLGRGSAVLFNGVKVGDVTRVYIDVSNPTVAIADTTIDRQTPITRSSRASIGIAGLTGQANIEIKGSDGQEPNILDEAEDAGVVAEIEADPSAVTNLLQTAQDIFRRADNVLSQLEGFATDVRGPLTETAENTRTFSQALARNAEGVDKFLESVANLSEELAGVSGKLDGTLQAAENILGAVDPERIKSVVENVDLFTRELSRTSTQFTEVVGDVRTTVNSVNEFAVQSQGTLGKVDRILEGVDPDTVRRAMTNIEQASRSANAAAADVSRVTERISRRSDDVDRIITESRELAQRLNAASTRVDGILVKVDNLLGSGEAEGLMADASETLKSFRQVADTLNSRLGTITDGLARFSGQGLREVEGLVRDARSSITRIERAVTDLERNPQRLITGGEGTVRQYDGRARR